MPGKSKYDGPGQRKFIRNMAAGGAIGAATGNAAAKIATKGRSRLVPVKSAALGGAAAGTAGLGMVIHQRRKKVKKDMSLSAFGVDHGREL